MFEFPFLISHFISLKASPTKKRKDGKQNDPPATPSRKSSKTPMTPFHKGAVPQRHVQRELSVLSINSRSSDEAPPLVSLFHNLCPFLTEHAGKLCTASLKSPEYSKSCSPTQTLMMRGFRNFHRLGRLAPETKTMMICEF